MALLLPPGVVTGQVLWLAGVPVQPATSNDNQQIVCKQKNGATNVTKVGDESAALSDSSDVRDGLKKAILDRRSAAGIKTDLADLDLWGDRSDNSANELTDEEKMKQQTRRRNNRLAALRCRRKQKTCRISIEQELFVETQKREQLLQKLTALERERLQVMTLWREFGDSNDQAQSQDGVAPVDSRREQEGTCVATHIEAMHESHATVIQLPAARVEDKNVVVKPAGSVNLPDDGELNTTCTMKLPVVCTNTASINVNTQSEDSSYNNSRINPVSKYSNGVAVGREVAYCCAKLVPDASMEGYSEMTEHYSTGNHDHTNDNLTNGDSNCTFQYNRREPCLSCDDGENVQSSDNDDMDDIEMYEEKRLVIDLTVYKEL